MKLHCNKIICSAILAAFVVLSSCAKKNTKSEEKEFKPIIVGFSQIGSESAWRTCNTQSMKEAAAVEDIQLVYANAEQKQENQIKAIRSFIVYQVDVIVFVPIVQDGWDNVLREAKEAGIPVIVIDRSIRTSDESLYAGYLGSDHTEEGRKAARFLQRKFSRVQRPLNILEIRGTDGSSAADGRYEGFREVINKDSRFKIIHSESGDFLRSRGKEIVERILSVNGKLQIDGQPIDIIFSHNDSMTLGFLDVLAEHGIRGGKDVTIVSVDAEQAAINALKEKKINCVVECNPKLGPQTMKLVKTLCNKYEIPHITRVDETVFTEYDNLSEITPRGY
ncbi:MAG: ABC transporter substrate-binding protein [Spirochaetaceae bacterium]|nr:ABC transporter substrate-binding protein [Spirochaetaceae bacterium]MBP5328371.1 ABC transporter substrate-binding protein [Spirochaetaceae bacterium]